jgi:hypothetical protein
LRARSILFFLFSSAAAIIHCALHIANVDKARSCRIGDMTPPAYRVGDGANKAAICRRPRAALSPMLALFVGGCKFERYRSVSFPPPLFYINFHDAHFPSAWMRLT